MEEHELVDINGKNTGKVLTHTEAQDINNIPKGYYLPIVGVVIINNKNEILLQKRSSLKRVNPNKWGLSGGKSNFGETTEESALRETLEEIGVKLDKEKLKFLCANIVDEVYYGTVYYIYQDVDVDKCVLQEEEVAEVKYFKIDEVERLNNEGIEWLDDLKKVLNKNT